MAMATINHSKIYALLKQVGAEKEDKEILVYNASGGKTISLSELHKTNWVAYNKLVKQLEDMVTTQEKTATTQISAAADMWRKRVIAAVSAWLTATGVEPADRLLYIKEIVCRTSSKPKDYFNKLTISQLRTAYNSFIKQTKHYEKTSKATDLFKTAQN
jgi:hypothetical protein